MSKKVNIKLPIPFKKDGKKITAIELRQPCSGDLRGLTLTAVCQMDFTAGCTLLPRISILNERDLLDMDTENLTVLLVGIASFFVNMKQ